MNGNNILNTTDDFCARLLKCRQERTQPARPMPANGRTQMPAAPADTAGTTIMPPADMTPTTLESVNYLAGLLTTYIGHRMRVQFLVGTTGPLMDINGTLRQVGANYIILQPVETDDLTVCDLYSIKFVTIFF
ncbi:MAG: hypothetical protein GXY20_05785 [Clostridiales bacterium]|nr:hypothetical protein [Clostridiales bacterium]